MKSGLEGSEKTWLEIQLKSPTNKAPVQSYFCPTNYSHPKRSAIPPKTEGKQEVLLPHVTLFGKNSKVAIYLRDPISLSTTDSRPQALDPKLWALKLKQIR